MNKRELFLCNITDNINRIPIEYRRRALNIIAADIGKSAISQSKDGCRFLGADVSDESLREISIMIDKYLE